MELTVNTYAEPLLTGGFLSGFHGTVGDCQFSLPVPNEWCYNATRQTCKITDPDGYTSEYYTGAKFPVANKLTASDPDLLEFIVSCYDKHKAQEHA
jgi:hypothetical protein